MKKYLKKTNITPKRNKKEQQIRPKRSKKKEIIKNRVKINKVKSKKYKRSMKPRNGSLKTNKIEKPLTRLIKKREDPNK